MATRFDRDNFLKVTLMKVEETMAAAAAAAVAAAKDAVSRAHDSAKAMKAWSLATKENEARLAAEAMRAVVIADSAWATAVQLAIESRCASHEVMLLWLQVGDKS